MLSRYFEQLKQLSELLSHGRDFDFNLWLKTIKLTALIMAQSIGFLIVLAIFILGPVYVFQKLRNSMNLKMKEAADAAAADAIAIKWRNIKIAYWICFAIIYVPFAIPTVLLFL